MTEEDLVTALGSLVSGRVYADEADLGEPMPFILWQHVGGRPTNFLTGDVADKKNARIQISVISSTRMESTKIIKQAENLLVQSPFFATVEGAPIGFTNTPEGIRGMHQDFGLWFEDIL